jgi:hypothetical protein
MEGAAQWGQSLFLVDNSKIKYVFYKLILFHYKRNFFYQILTHKISSIFATQYSNQFIMKKLLLLIALMISVTGFSQITVKEFLQNRNPKKEFQFERNPLSFKDMNSQEPETMKQCLDSVITLSYKEFFTYDKKGNHTLYESYFFDENENKWAGSAKKEFAYDANGNVTAFIYYSWNHDSNDWTVSSKEEYEFDFHNNTTLYIYSYWDNNVLIDRYKCEYSYDYENSASYGKEIINLRYDWDYGNNDWIKKYKGESEYDDGNLILYYDYEWINNKWELYYKIENSYKNGNVTLCIVYDYFENSWLYSSKEEWEYDIYENETLNMMYIWSEDWVVSYGSKTEYDYDPNGNVTSLTAYWWMDNEWTPVYKSVYEYHEDGSGNVTMSEAYLWDPESNAWNGFEKYIYQYSLGKLTTQICYTWDWDLNNWANFGKYEYDYNSAGNMTNVTSYSWEGNSWIEESKFEYTYDLDYTLNDLIYPPDFYMENKKMEEKRFYWNGTNWEESYVVTYYWSEKDIIDGISDTKSQNSSITVYPNPTTGELRVTSGELQITSIEVFDTYGRTISTHYSLLTTHYSIDLSHLPSGIYLVIINAETGIQIRKVIKL